jgi:hypothetical protein
MDFLELQQRLRDARLDAFLAYDSRHNTLSPAGQAPGYCRFAWSVQQHDDLPLPFSVSQRELFRPPRYGRDDEGPEPVYFESAERANSHIWELIAPTAGAGPVDAVTSADLPGDFVAWLEAVGWSPTRELFGNVFVASFSTQSLRIAHTSRGYDVHLLDHLVIRRDPPLQSTERLEDALLWIMLFVGHRYIRPLGQAIWSFRNHVGDIERARAYSLRELGDAFLDADGGGILDFIAHGPAIDLLTPELLAEAATARFVVKQRAEARSITLNEYTLREVDDGYTISYRERNDDTVISRVNSLAELREEFARRVLRSC